MLKKYNKEIVREGSKLRTELLFDIPQRVNHHLFFKTKFLKEKLIENLVLKFTKC